MEKESHIYGARAVMEALKAGEPVDRIYLQKGYNGSLVQELQSHARRKGVHISFVPEERMARFRDRNHQGVVAKISPISFLDYKSLIDKAIEDTKAPLFLLLDGISDVRNLGAIIRTAACTGVDGIILPFSGSAPINADTVKTSAGAVFNVPLSKAAHIKDAVYYLQASGVQVLAASEKADQTLYDMDLKGGIAFVMGSEGKGVSPAVLKAVDGKARLPMSGKIASLNVSVACGVILYEILRQRSS